MEALEEKVKGLRLGTRERLDKLKGSAEEWRNLQLDRGQKPKQRRLVFWRPAKDRSLESGAPALMEGARGTRREAGPSTRGRDFSRMTHRRANRSNRAPSIESIYWCAGYTKGFCKTLPPHMAQVMGEKVTVLHICAACYKRRGIKVAHAPTDPPCCQPNM